MVLCLVHSKWCAELSITRNCETLNVRLYCEERCNALWQALTLGLNQFLFQRMTRSFSLSYWRRSLWWWPIREEHFISTIWTFPDSRVNSDRGQQQSRSRNTWNALLHHCASTLAGDCHTHSDLSSLAVCHKCSITVDLLHRLSCRITIVLPFAWRDEIRALLCALKHTKTGGPTLYILQPWVVKMNIDTCMLWTCL